MSPTIPPGVVQTPIARALLRAFGLRLGHHLAALVAALLPYLVSVIGGSLTIREAAALSTGVVVAWLLGVSHVHGKVAGAITRDVTDLAGATIGQLGHLGGGLFAGMAPPPGMDIPQAPPAPHAHHAAKAHPHG